MALIKLGHHINGNWCHSFSVQSTVWTTIKQRQKAFHSEDFVLPDGSKPNPRDRIVCGTCQMIVYPPSLKVLS